jgi:hypothetical protein
MSCAYREVLDIEVGTAARVSREASDSRDVYFVHIHTTQVSRKGCPSFTRFFLVNLRLCSVTC